MNAIEALKSERLKAGAEIRRKLSAAIFRKHGSIHRAATASGMTYMRIYRYLNSESVPNPEALERMLKRLKIPASEVARKLR